MIKKINSSPLIQSRLTIKSVSRIIEKTEKFHRFEKKDSKVTLEEVRNVSITSFSSSQSENYSKSYNYELEKFNVKKVKPYFTRLFADQLYKTFDPSDFFGFCNEGMIYLHIIHDKLIIYIKAIEDPKKLVYSRNLQKFEKMGNFILFIYYYTAHFNYLK